MANIAALNTVYNHFMTTYAPSGTNTKYDTHKKSELRSVYNSIIKLNKESPLFLIDKSSQTQEFAVGLKESSRTLKNIISSLSIDDGSDLLSKKVVSSSNEDIVTASYTGKADGVEEVASFEIEVKQLAKSQQNIGNFLPENGMDLKSDTYSFDIHSRGMDYEFQFNINDGDTNRLIEEKLARLITKSNIGLQASTIYDNNGNVALMLESTETGLRGDAETLFQVSDNKTSKKTGAVDYFDINRTTQYPCNSSFILNGEERSTLSNQFTIDRVFELSLNGVSAEGASSSIGLKTDIDSITENVSHLVEGYNSFLQKAAAYLERQPYSKKLIQEMTNISSLYENDLESIGLVVEDDGHISLDKNLLQQTAQEEDALDRFKSIKNFTGNILNKTNQISLNPMQYTQKTIVAYKNPGHSFASPYITSNYSGMMFSSYC